jgi:hypothetical protein
VFTARYALSPYIKQIRFVFKGLIRFAYWGGGGGLQLQRYLNFDFKWLRLKYFACDLKTRFNHLLGCCFCTTVFMPALANELAKSTKRSS